MAGEHDELSEGHDHTELQPLTHDSIVQTMVDFAVSSQEPGLERPLVVDDFLEGSVFLALFEGVANPIGFLMYELMVDLPGRFYLNQATGEALDRLVSNFTFGQVVRVPESSGAGPLLFEGEPQTIVPANLELRAPNGVLVKNLVVVQIPTGETEVASAGAATVTGAITNLTAGTELQILNPVAGITRVTVSEQWAGGADVQSNESLRDAVIDFLDSLAKGVRPAIILGARQSGYGRVVVLEPGTGRVVAYVDDGQPVSQTKLDEARVSIHRFWKAAGARLQVLPRIDKPVTLKAKAFSDGVVPLATLQAALEARWANYFTTLQMGDGLARLDLLGQAATVPGYNGVSLEDPATDIQVLQPLDEYWTEWPEAGAGTMYPYERLTLAGVEWS